MSGAKVPVDVDLLRRIYAALAVEKPTPYLRVEHEDWQALGEAIDQATEETLRPELAFLADWMAAAYAGAPYLRETVKVVRVNGLATETFE